MLKWVEDHGENEITMDAVEAVRDSYELMMDICPVEASEQMWAYLNLNLQGSILETFHNVEELNGAEAWRRVVEPINANSMAKRRGLRKKAQDPQAANKLSDFDATLVRWETDYRQCLECGGAPIDDETRRETLCNILPLGLTAWALGQMHRV